MLPIISRFLKFKIYVHLFVGGGIATANFDGESDGEGIDESLMGNSTSTFFPSGQNPNAYRRAAPVMGNRGLETQRISQERSRSKPKSYSKDRGSGGGSPRSGRRERRGGSASGTSSSGGGSGATAASLIQVAALDERNLKRAVHRYGTLPKGARIGAYLESLRQSGMTPEPVTEQGVESDATLDSSSQGGGGDTLERSVHSGRSSRDGVRPAQMLRSNSSHGGFPAASAPVNHRASPSPRTNPSQLRRLQQASFNDMESNRNMGAGGAFALSDLEFPPPPNDLPPPPESPRRASGTPPPPPKPSPSPRTKRRVGPEFSNKENLPERLARASRRNREASSDSCESGRSYEGAALYNMPKSPVSPLSENRTLGSPAVGSLSSPGSGLDSGAGPTNSSDPIRPYSVKKSDMELKLVNEIRERSDLKKSPVKEIPPGRGTTVSGSGSSPAAMLVSELFESIKAKNNSSKVAQPEKPVEQTPAVEIDFKANLRKVTKSISDDPEKSRPLQQIDFKSQLKKKTESKPELDNNSEQSNQKTNNDESLNFVDFKSKLRKSKPEAVSSSSAQQQENTEPLDFKARLRKVSDGTKTAVQAQAASNNEQQLQEEELNENDDNSLEQQRDILDKRDSVGSIEDNEKRKSTGSISSLRKMWESSPKIGGRKSAPPPEELNADLSPESAPSSANNPSSVKFEKRVWPPVPNTEMEKPMVPVKPTVKPPAPTTKPPPPKDPSVVAAGVKLAPKPAMAVKPNVCNIYAAPSTTTTSKPKLPANKPAPMTSSTKNGDVITTEPDRDSILNVSQRLESSLDVAKRDNANLSKVDLSNLSDQIGTFHSTCSGFIDSVPPTTRFRFRSLLTKLDQQSKEFSANVSSSSSAGTTTSNRLAGDIQVTLRDLVTVIQR